MNAESGEVGIVTAEVRGHFGPSAVVKYSLNQGGFVNHSFSVDTPDGALWLKVAGHASRDAGLEQWARLSPILAERYRAPAVVERLRIGGRTALVFPRLDLPLATPDSLKAAMPQLVDLLARLHSDDELAVAVHGAPNLTAGDVFRSVWVRRLREDLRLLEGAVPFVDGELLAWMAREVDKVEAGTTSPPFESPAMSPIHGDVWCNNVMIGPAEMWLIDWDDLGTGDPVVDAAILLYNSYGADLAAWTAAWPPGDQDEATRFAVALRAQALDAVIDVLADWVEAAKAPDHIDAVRADKEASHRSALAQYRDLYPQ